MKASMPQVFFKPSVFSPANNSHRNDFAALLFLKQIVGKRKWEGIVWFQNFMNEDPDFSYFHGTERPGEYSVIPTILSVPPLIGVIVHELSLTDVLLNTKVLYSDDTRHILYACTSGQKWQTTIYEWIRRRTVQLKILAPYERRRFVLIRFERFKAYRKDIVPNRLICLHTCGNIGLKLLASSALAMSHKLKEISWSRIRAKRITLNSNVFTYRFCVVRFDFFKIQSVVRFEAGSFIQCFCRLIIESNFDFWNSHSHKSLEHGKVFK